jgi:hypothetical protein
LTLRALAYAAALKRAERALGRAHSNLLRSFSLATGAAAFDPLPLAYAGGAAIHSLVQRIRVAVEKPLSHGVVALRIGSEHLIT